MMPVMVKETDLNRVEVPEDYEVLDATALERVMNLGENRIEMRIPRSAWFLRDLRFPHS
jgi:hypothetical protein